MFTSFNFFLSFRHHRHKDSRHRKDNRHDGLSREELEIQEANETRARLGMAPLRR